MLAISQFQEGLALANHVPTIAYGDSFRFQNMDGACLSVKASGTTIRYSVYLQQSHKRPTTEGSADTVNYQELPDALVDIENNFAIVDSNWHHFPLSLDAALEYARSIIKSNASNGADTEIEWKISIQDYPRS